MKTKEPAAQKPLTLNQFVKACGSLEAAAAQAGVSGSTFWRWLHDGSKPQGNNARRLKELGVIFAIALVLGGCASAYRVDLVNARILDWGGGNSISIIEDPQTKAICYAYSRGGVTCEVPR
jgi:hypothetical protein